MAVMQYEIYIWSLSTVSDRALNSLGISLVIGMIRVSFVAMRRFLLGSLDSFRLRTGHQKNQGMI
jgi:hypothetical protein